MQTKITQVNTDLAKQLSLLAFLRSACSHVP